MSDIDDGGLTYSAKDHALDASYRLAFEQAQESIWLARQQGCKCDWELRDDELFVNARRYLRVGCPVHGVSDERSDQPEQ